ncbi:MAG: hypothetical protein K0R69_558 [Clostridia bacterium]|jgi:hypothetical protein|nr:hypothetical protein [Clostridia bacterium]
MNHTTNPLFVGISYSYINYIHNYLALLNNSLYSSVKYLDEETSSILDELKTVFLSLPDILSGNSKIKENHVLQIISFRTILEKKYRVLTAYQRELQHLTTSYNITHSLSEETYPLNEEDSFLIDSERLASDCVTFVFSENNIRIKQQNAALLLPYIPIKLTKENYLHYVKKSLEQIELNPHADDTALLISVLSQLFDGHSCPEYGEHFKDLSATLTELKCETSADAFYDNTQLTEETLETLLKMLHSLYKLTGSLNNLLVFDQLDFTAVTDLHISFYDLYYSLKNIITSDEDKELFLSSLPERVKDIKTSLQLDYEKASHSQSDPLFSLIQTYLSMDIGNVFGFTIRKSSSAAAEMSTLFNPFLDTLRETLLKLPSADRKLRMQYFISAIPFIMSDKTFYAYTKQAFSSLSPSSTNFVYALYINNILEENSSITTDVDE